MLSTCTFVCPTLVHHSWMICLAFWLSYKPAESMGTSLWVVSLLFPAIFNAFIEFSWPLTWTHRTHQCRINHTSPAVGPQYLCFSRAKLSGMLWWWSSTQANTKTKLWQHTSFPESGCVIAGRKPFPSPLLLLLLPLCHCSCYRL